VSPTASDKYMNAADSPALTLLYDGGCPLCLREVELLGRKDLQRHGEQLKLAFVDIDQVDYNPDSYAGISYREAMGRIHAIDANGAVLRDVEVFRRAYELIGLGWIYAPTQWPLLRPLTNLAYGIWANMRLRITGRPSLESLCHARSGGCQTD
jgi:predicted DCC family thiol-disulfide oxidoreductase YuxK